MAICPSFPSRLRSRLTLALISTFAAGLASASTLQGEYLFNNSFASTLAGAPALVAVDPLGTNGFMSDTVFGQSRTVYASNGTGASNAGLTLNTTGLVSNTSYSVEMLFDVTGGNDLYKRLLRTGPNDNGLYVDPAGKLNTYTGPSGPNSGLAFSLNTYHDMVVTVSGGWTKVWLDGSLSHTVATNVLDISAPANILNFYIDEYTEFTNARTALIRLWDGALGSGDIAALAADPLTSRADTLPEPSAIALFATGLGLAGFAARKRRSRL
ncbi:MAG: PEP-CTERM sorting domain-containing protein [Rhodocyclaceae bacterium]|nr:PEP-CTERM sorting domain-containing protein [Rhodocyclaceae bacterium]